MWGSAILRHINPVDHGIAALYWATDAVRGCRLHRLNLQGGIEGPDKKETRYSKRLTYHLWGKVDLQDEARDSSCLA